MLRIRLMSRLGLLGPLVRLARWSVSEQERPLRPAPSPRAAERGARLQAN
jgi:hypothetical protein